MDAESLELEDGEVVDGEPEDTFGTYNILQRPHLISQSQELAKIKYSDESDESSAPESDSDSDSMCVKAKRPKLKLKQIRFDRENSVKNDKFKVWSMQVQEESITEDLISCGVTTNNYKDRTVESYDFTLGYNIRKGERPQENNTSDEEKEVEERLTNKRSLDDRHNSKLRLEKRRLENKNSDRKGSPRVIADLSVTAESTEVEIATDIAMKLSEKKDVLIRRIVHILGKERAVHFFQKTKQIEENGGMLIMNGSRRRTAGGVYLYLVKNDDYLPQEKIREIFHIDKKEHVMQRKHAESSESRRKAQKLIRKFENGSNKDLPALLTRAELSTKQIAEEARLRRGEGIERVPLDSDKTVSNPPPSPVTDDPDHSEHLIPGRHEIDYNDFIEIGDVDNMEVF